MVGKNSFCAAFGKSFFYFFIPFKIGNFTTPIIINDFKYFYTLAYVNVTYSSKSVMYKI